jgi:hypothetical protein
MNVDDDDLSILDMSGDISILDEIDEIDNLFANDDEYTDVQGTATRGQGPRNPRNE